MLKLRPLSSALVALIIASAMSGCGGGNREPTTAPTSVSSVAPTTADAVAKAASAAKAVAAAKPARPAKVVAKAKAKTAAPAEPKAQATAPTGARAAVAAKAAKAATAEVRKLPAVPSLSAGATAKDVKAVVSSLQARGDIYFVAADYKDAAVWETKVLAVDPKNQVALLALGAARFNQGNTAEARKQWLVAAALYPKLDEVHYDLGFLYWSQTPPDKAKMTAEWDKVVAIDPNSQLSKTVAQLKDR